MMMMMMMMTMIPPCTSLNINPTIIITSSTSTTIIDSGRAEDVRQLRLDRQHELCRLGSDEGRGNLATDHSVPNTTLNTIETSSSISSSTSLNTIIGNFFKPLSILHMTSSSSISIIMMIVVVVVVVVL